MDSGENIELLELTWRIVPTSTKNLNFMGIMIYSKILRNEKYHKKFWIQKLPNPATKSNIATTKFCLR